MSTLYKVCKRTIERQARPLSDEFIADMQEKLDLYSAAGKITAEEYVELSAMLVNETNQTKLAFWGVTEN